MSPGSLERWREGERVSEWQNTLVEYAQDCVASGLDLGFCLTIPCRISRDSTGMGAVGDRRELCLALDPPYRGIRRWGCWRLIEVLLVR